MENYCKGKNVEPSLESLGHPYSSIVSSDTVWMKVKPGSKIPNLVTYAVSDLKNKDHIVWSGSGLAVGKVVSCVEIVKRRYKKLVQITRIAYVDSEEYWDPKEEGLDQLKVNRKIPVIHILLSKLPLSENEPGYQAPGTNLFDVPEPSRKKPKVTDRRVPAGKETVAEEK